MPAKNRKTARKKSAFAETRKAARKKSELAELLDKPEYAAVRAMTEHWSARNQRFEALGTLIGIVIKFGLMLGAAWLGGILLQHLLTTPCRYCF